MVGNSDSGKTTIAKALSQRLSAPHLEIDSIYHQLGWTPLPLPEFRERVAAFITSDRWVADGNYSEVRDLIWARADTVVWLDPPRSKTMCQLGRRTLGRAVTRHELWNGNRESLRDVLSRDPERSVLVWSWNQHGKYRALYEEASSDPANAHLAFHRLRTRTEVAALLQQAGVGAR